MHISVYDLMHIDSYELAQQISITAISTFRKGYGWEFIQIKGIDGARCHRI